MATSSILKEIFAAMAIINYKKSINYFVTVFSHKLI